MIEAQVRRLVAEQLDIGCDAVHPQSRLVEDLGAASVDIVALMVTLEEEFGVEFPFEEVDHLTTSAKIAATVARLIPAGDASCRRAATGT